MNLLIYLAVCFFFIVLLVIGVFNSGDVTVNLVFWQLGPAPMGMMIAASAIFGVAFTCVVGVIDGIKIRIANRQLRRQVQRLDEEADALRLRLARHEGHGAETPRPEDTPAVGDHPVF